MTYVEERLHIHSRGTMLQMLPWTRGPRCHHSEWTAEPLTTSRSFVYARWIRSGTSFRRTVRLRRLPNVNPACR